MGVLKAVGMWILKLFLSGIGVKIRTEEQARLEKERDAALAREEVFGPVLAVTPFKDDAEALRLANATDFGLAAGLWTSNLSRAHRMVRGIRAGVVHVNTYGGTDNSVPLGGVKQSGNGHDKSLHALDKYTDLKTAWIQL